MPGRENQAKPRDIVPPMELKLCSHSLRQRPMRRRFGWSARKPGRRSNRRSARPPLPSPNVAALSRKRDACNFSQAKLARSRASCSELTRRTRRRAIRSRPESSQRLCPKACTGSPTLSKPPISPRSAFCSRSTATTASRPTRRRSPASWRLTMWTPSGFSALPRRSLTDAISSTRLPTCSVLTRSNKRSSSSPSILTPASPWCAATSSPPRTFLLSTPSDALAPRRRGSSTSPGDARMRRKSRLSAKGSPSTPAASTSSRPRAWSS